MMNWNAVRFVDCALCDEACEAFNAGGVAYEPTRSLCGYCLWRFSRTLGQRRKSDCTPQERDILFTEWVARECQKLAAAQAVGKTKFGTWQGKSKRKQNIARAAKDAAYSRMMFRRDPMWRARG